MSFAWSQVKVGEDITVTTIRHVSLFLALLGFVVLPLGADGHALWVGLAVAAAVGANAFIARSRPGLAGMLLVVELACGTSFVAVETGGLASGVAPWVAVSPFAAAAVGGERTVWGTATLGFLVYLGMLLVGPVDVARLAHFASYVGLLTLLTASAVALISARRQIAERLAAENLALRALFEAAGDGVLIADRGVVVYANPQVCLDLRCTRTELVGRALDGLAELPSESDVPAGLVKLPRGDGTTMLADIRVGSVPSGRVVWMVRDVEALEQSRRSLDDARDLAHRAGLARRQFVRIAGHELRTPLAAVLGFAQVLELDAAGLGPAQRTAVEQIALGAHRLSLLLDALTAIETSDTRTATPTPCDVAACLQLAGARARAADRLEVLLPSDLPRVRADMGTLVDALTRLLTHRGDENGKVEVSARVGRDGVQLQIREESPLCATLDPSAVGAIDATEDLAEASIGLGLRAAEALVAALGSQLRIRTLSGASNTFTFVLPVDGPRRAS